MRYRPFGHTGMYVSEIVLGTMTFGGTGFWEHIGKLSVAEAEKMIGTALDAGVNLIDTADGYRSANPKSSSARRSARSAARAIR